jgi:ATP-binding cassette subfamily F protein 3
MLSLNNIACRRDRELLFDGVSVVVHRGQKVGLTGANGCGKSSLFAMIQGELEPDDGEISLQQQVTVTHVAQESHVSSSPALDFVIDGDKKLRALESQLESVQNDGEKHAELLAELEQAGGYTVKSRAGALLNGLGFTTDQHSLPVSGFSGGWRMRLNLAQALMSPSDLLLLDEPTNHLDLDAVLWLEQWLRQREGTLLMISHDREFLDRITTHTLHIEQKSAHLYTGNYSEFETQRASRLANQQALYVKQQQSIAQMQSFVDRFRAKATKARQAQSRIKMLERMTKLAPAHVDSPFQFSFLKPESLPNPLLLLRDADIGYNDTTILNNISLNIQSGDRIGLLGANGAGKSTLIKAIVGDLALQSGERLPAHKLVIGYFAQHQVDQLRDDQSPLQAIQTANPALSDTDARNYLGGFGFVGDQALQSANTMSGGERARLALALIVYTKPNLLLLDEPTNHLDIQMRDALAHALQEYGGALMVISHDRSLLRSVVDDLILVTDGKVDPFDDDLDGYARWLSDYRSKAGSANSKQTVTSSSPAVDRKQQKRDEAAARALLRPLTQAVQKCERQLEKALAELSETRTSLASNELYHSENKTKLTELLAKESDQKRSVEHIEEQLLDAMQALELAQTDNHD